MDVEKEPKKAASDIKISEADSAKSGIVTEPKKAGFFKNIIDGFRRADLAGVDTGDMTQEEIQDYLTSKAPLKRSLHPWQISLIAIGGSIGSGLFVGVGNSFKTGGVAAVVIGYIVMGIMIFCTMQSVGCLATEIPVNGSYIYYCSRFVSRSAGCMLAWLYIEGWIINVPLELISSAITISYWDSDNNAATRVNKVAWIALFYAVVFFINLFGAAGYGWGESILSISKVITILGFCILGIIIACGGYSGTYAQNHLDVQPDYLHGLKGKYIGAHFWYDPGAFSAGFKGVVTTAVNAAYSFSGTELAALAAAETKNPEKAVPRAIKQVFWRILLFYVVSLTIVGTLVPYTDSRLGTTSDGRASPFVIAVSNANIKALPSILNAVILLAVLSVGNAGVYACSRTAASMAAQGFAPRWFGYIDRQGRPLAGIGLSALFGLLCFLAAYEGYGDVFNWMLSLSGIGALVSWGFINIATLRFYLGMRAQKRSYDELLFKPMGGIWTPILGAFLNFGTLCLQFWVALFPVGEKKPDVVAFFQVYLSVPVIILFYAFSKYFMKENFWYIKASDMDLDTGRRDLDPETMVQLNREEAERVRAKGILYRLYRYWC